METIKKKEKSDLEQLLNMLIQRGWKPFGNKKIKDAKTARWNINLLDEEVNKVSKFKDKVAFTNGVLIFDEINLRELVSRESGLWQFCIANHLLKKYSDLGDDNEYVIGRRQNGMDGKTTDGEYIDEDYDSDTYHQDESYQRWLIESSLKDESELEDFLLSNIVIKDE